MTQAAAEEEPALPELIPAHPSLELQHVHGYSGGCMLVTAAKQHQQPAISMHLCATGCCLCCSQQEANSNPILQ
jgi:hypothetical protein